MELGREKYVENIQDKYEQLSFCLNEKSRRLWAATEAKSIGRGGISIVHDATGIDFKTIRKGIKELEGSGQNKRVRKTGGGRKKLKDVEMNLVSDLQVLVDPVTRGDPESPLLWTCKSTYKLCEELNNQGYNISQKTVYSLLVDMDWV
ncbi:ISAzo13 family transposase ISDpr8 [subsurface metagenome]